MTSRLSPRILHHPTGTIIQAFPCDIYIGDSERADVLHAILILDISFIRWRSAYISGKQPSDPHPE